MKWNETKRNEYVWVSWSLEFKEKLKQMYNIETCFYAYALMHILHHKQYNFVRELSNFLKPIQVLCIA